MISQHFRTLHYNFVPLHISSCIFCTIKCVVWFFWYSRNKKHIPYLSSRLLFTCFTSLILCVFFLLFSLSLSHSFSYISTGDTLSNSHFLSIENENANKCATREVMLLKQIPYNIMLALSIVLSHFLISSVLNYFPSSYYRWMAVEHLGVLISSKQLLEHHNQQQQRPKATVFYVHWTFFTPPYVCIYYYVK